MSPIKWLIYAKVVLDLFNVGSVREAETHTFSACDWSSHCHGVMEMTPFFCGWILQKQSSSNLLVDVVCGHEL